MFSRFVLCAAAILTGLVSVPVAEAQPRPPSGDPPGSNLTATASAFGGYDTDVTGLATSSSTQTSAPLVGSNLALNYRVRSERIAFGTRGAADTRHYRTSPSITSTGFSGSATVGAEVTSRLTVNAAVTSRYAPQFVFSMLPGTSEIPADAPPPSGDYGLIEQDSFSYTAGTNATFKVSRRSGLTMSYGVGRYRYLGGEYGQYSSNSENYGFGYSYTATRYTTLRVGYSVQEARYPAFQGQPSYAYRQRSIDAGVNYSRPISLSRRTTFSFGTGSAAVDDGIETFFTLTGNASLRHQIGRTWSTAVVYARGLGIVGGFAQPFFSDAVSLSIEGMATSRVTFSAGGGYAKGNIGYGSRANDFAYYQGTARMEYEVKRGRVGVFGSYSYYAYGFDNRPDAPLGVPGEIGRHGVRGGLLVKLPIVEERNPRATR